jgi:hypothetical protein
MKLGIIRGAQAQIKCSHASSGRAQECLGVLSYSLRYLLIAHVAPLWNSSSNPEKASSRGRFHAIIYCYLLYRGIHLQLLKDLDSRLCG